MLLSVMDLISNQAITNNRIYFDNTLRHLFTSHFNQHRTETDRDNPHLPFFHLRGDGFWHHQPKPGRANAYVELTSASGPGDINNNIAYSYLDDELFQLLRNRVAREYLKASLLDNLNPDAQRLILDQGDAWDWLECEAIVADYFAMLELEFKGERYNKAQHRRELQNKLNNRSEGSIEFKHQNISAVLIELGYPYISGYKPAYNYQQQLKEVVLARLAVTRKELEQEVDSYIEQDPPEVGEFVWSDVLEEAPEIRETDNSSGTREYSPRFYDYAKKEGVNRKIGERGEEFALKVEKNRLQLLGREDLAKEVEWTSKVKGDGAGYDIRSFDHEREKELFIEVKTSNGGKYQPFYISENEVAFAKDYSEQYSLYRVFNFKRGPKLFILPGDIRQNVQLVANTYKAIF
ncbi:MAG: DUF3883 domain-containing protein [Desulfobulbaceae bacterium]|nr:DUF3883 domain-containing protein [Desulfobulbaceae bacterium]